MKTPEEWDAILRGYGAVLSDELLMRIQQDAYLAGLKKASEIASPLHSDPNCNCPACRHAKRNIKAILAEMERVKTTTPNATP